MRYQWIEYTNTISPLPRQVGTMLGDIASAHPGRYYVCIYCGTKPHGSLSRAVDSNFQWQYMRFKFEMANLPRATHLDVASRARPHQPLSIP